MNTSQPLGSPQHIVLPQGTIRYYEQGSGPTLLFVHGVFASSTLWRDVVPSLAPHFRCIVPELPLGAHSIPLPPTAACTPPFVAQLVADIMVTLDLHDVVLVGNNTGGAICQLVVANYPERISRLVLTNCDAFEQFFPWLIQPLHTGAALLGTRFTAALARILRWRSAQRLLLAVVSNRPASNELLAAYFSSFLTDKGVRRDIARFLASVSNRYTLAAAATFAHFHRLVLIVWGKDDLFFSGSLARRLQQAFPQASLKWVAGSRAFVPQDQPHVLAQHIKEFLDAD